MLGPHRSRDRDLLLVLDWESACPFVEQEATYVLTDRQNGLSIKSMSFFDTRIALYTADILQSHHLRS